MGQLNDYAYFIFSSKFSMCVCVCVFVEAQYECVVVFSRLRTNSFEFCCHRMGMETINHPIANN